jgi:hypothetical protein
VGIWSLVIVYELIPACIHMCTKAEFQAVIHLCFAKLSRHQSVWVLYVVLRERNGVWIHSRHKIRTMSSNFRYGRTHLIWLLIQKVKWRWSLGIFIVKIITES